MTTVRTNDQHYYDIADAIRDKLDVETLYLPSEMAEAIESISSGITSADEGKVVDNGVLVAQTALQVSENGTYYTKTNDLVEVDVQGVDGRFVEKTISHNGVYDPVNDGADGYSLVTAEFEDANIYNGKTESEYLFEEAGGRICTLIGTYVSEYRKVTSDPAYVAYFSTGSFTGPILVSKVADAVKYIIAGQVFSSSGSLEYDGDTWYYSSTEYFQSGNLQSTGGFAQKLDGTLSVVEAAELLLDLASDELGLKFTANGHYDVPSGYDGFGALDVAVLPNLLEKTITENDHYDVPSGYDGFGALDVSVLPNLMEKTITENGVYNSADDNVDGYSSVKVNVSGGGGGDTLSYSINMSTAVIKKESSMGVDTSSGDVEISYTSGGYIGACVFMPIYIPENSDCIKYKLSTGASYQTTDPRKFGIGIVPVSQGVSAWVFSNSATFEAVNTCDVNNLTETEYELDVSEVPVGGKYLCITAHGWNATVSDLEMVFL